MSGTSVDGIDVAIVDISGRTRLKVEPVAHHTVPYPKAVRQAILGVSNQMTHTAVISRLHALLGELYAEAIQATAKRKRIKLGSIKLIGVHGQTVFHEPIPVRFLNRKIASTLQLGDAAVVAERTGIETISNFRERDVAAGGNGAPLVPFVDYILFRDRREGRIALNIGGIANLTAIPAAASPEDVLAFDTGPGNMLIDALTEKLTGGAKTYDRGGAIARRGTVHEKLLTSMLSDPYFKKAPPKTTGRETFGAEFLNGLLATGIPIEDLIATATELTAQSIAGAICKVTAQLAGRKPSQPASGRQGTLRASESWQIIASGGGVRNHYLFQRLKASLAGIEGVRMELTTSASFGIDPDAKEAIAFAVLAHRTKHGLAGNLPSATGAGRAVVLGRSTLGRSTLGRSALGRSALGRSTLGRP